MTDRPKIDRIAQEMQYASEAFSKHEIVKQGEARWLVRQPGRVTFWFEVVVLAGGNLLVHGDIQAVIFGHYYASEKATPDFAARQTVRWMASRKRPDDSYFVEKAGIGGTADETIWTYDEEVLREEIRELIKEVSEGEVDEDGAVDSVKRERREELERVLNHVGDASLDEMQHRIYEALDGDPERVPQGQIISTAMVYAHAALQCLARLLDAAENGVRCG